MNQLQQKIIVSDYNPEWIMEFKALKSVYTKHLGDQIIAVEHVGSTSVKGLKAKPKIDIDIIIKNDESLKQNVLKKMSELGYEPIGDLGIVGREAFRRSSDLIPNIGTGKQWPIHNVYVCCESNMGLENHLKFRDYLRKHPKAVAEYGALKTALAQQFPYDMDAYIDGKTDFIIGILNKAGLSKAATTLIESQNKL